MVENEILTRLGMKVKYEVSKKLTKRKNVDAITRHFYQKPNPTTSTTCTGALELILPPVLAQNALNSCILQVPPWAGQYVCHCLAGE